MLPTRAFLRHEAQITFTRDWRQLQHGILLPGSKLHIWYDADRLPHERSQVGGKPAWNITAFARFGGGQEVHEFKLWSRTGRVLTRKATIDPGEGTMMIGKIPVPRTAADVELWFRNTGATSAVYWDSAYGANYLFRFVAMDIDELDATVITKPGTPFSTFQITLTTPPEITSVSVSYRVVNVEPGLAASETLALDRDSTLDVNNRIGWRGSVNVPYNAVVAFVINYVVGGRTFVDDNSEQMFLAPRPGSKAAAAQATEAARLRK